MKIHAKKSLGQNFLKSKKALFAMLEAGEIVPEDTILEIGPGLGVLTEKLLETGAKIIAVEKDNELIGFLKEKFAKEIENKQLTLIHGDILELDLNLLGLKANSYKLIANIPYYITGLIFRKFLSGNIHPHTNSSFKNNDKKNLHTKIGIGVQPEKIVIMVQKEIADRIIARDGKESLLSLSVKVYGTAKKIMKVEKENFSPKPKVDSAVLLIDNISKAFFKEMNHEKPSDIMTNEKKFFEIIKAGFAHKRKILMANLKEKSGKNHLYEIFQKLKISEKTRAEDLKLEDWIKLISELG